MKFRKFLLLIISFNLLFLLFSNKVYASFYEKKDELTLGTFQTNIDGIFEFKNLGFDFKTNLKSNASFDKKNTLYFSYNIMLSSNRNFLIDGFIIKHLGTLQAFSNNNFLMIDNINFGTNESFILTDLRSTQLNLMILKHILKDDNDKNYIGLSLGVKTYMLSLDLNNQILKTKYNYKKNIGVPFLGINIKCKINDNVKLISNLYKGKLSNKSISKNEYETLNYDAGISYRLTPYKPDYQIIAPVEYYQKLKKEDKSLEWFIDILYRYDKFKEKKDLNIIEILHKGPMLNFKCLF